MHSPPAFVGPVGLPKAFLEQNNVLASPHGARARKCVERKYVQKPVTSASHRDSSVSQRLVAALAAGLLAFSPAIGVAWQGGFDLFSARAAKGGGDTFLSASGNVNKDAESLLRWSLPIDNSAVRDLQASLESATGNTRGLKWNKVESDVRRAKGILNNRTSAILDGVSPEKRDEAEQLLTKVADAISSGLSGASQTPGLVDLVANRKVDAFVAANRSVLADIGRVEEMMVTAFPFEIPSEYSTLPRLMGRATVEIVVRKDGGEPFDIAGTLYNEGEMTAVLDGYSSPLSAGSFIDLASRGFYNNKPVIRSDGFIIQSGKPEKGEGYALPDGSIRRIPLEILAKGDREPLYGLTMEEDGRGSAATALPFSSFGTLAMAREEFEPNTGSSQFFWFLFEPDLTPAGRNLMDGSWSVFGYTTSGEQFLKGLERGDRIVSVKVTAGLENLEGGEGKSAKADV